MNGETVTGVTTFLIDRDIDTGRILLSHATEIGSEETAGQLHDRLMQMGAALVTETVKGLAEKTLKPVPQIIAPGTVLKSAPKIFPADTVIDWTQPAFMVHNKIRGLSPYPGAVTTLIIAGRPVRLKLLGSKQAVGFNPEPGLITVGNRKQLFISCRTGSVEITEILPEGRKRMTAAEFLRGYDITGSTLA